MGIVAAAGTQGALMRTLPWQRVAGAVVVLASVVIALAMSPGDPRLPYLWVFGLAAGFTLQRSRFCFASAFRDLYLFGSGRIMKGILVGVAVATLGFAVVMRNAVPFPGFGALPPEAHILPVGVTTILGGLLFGVGMVLAGGCISGSLFRSAEGYVGSWVAIAGAVIGLGAMSQTWNWWWSVALAAEPKLWLPALFNLGYGGAVILTLAAAIAAYVLIVWWEARSGVPTVKAIADLLPDDTVGQRLRATAQRVFVNGWSPIVGGAVLGGLNILMYSVHMPWGVTGELSRWANSLMTSVGAAPPVALGLSAIGGCAARASEVSGVFSHTFAVTVGLIAGALAAALFANEFKLRFPRTARRYYQSLAGGLLMGYGAGLAIGCTIGAFFSSIASLSVSGWLFGAALFGGALLGTKLIQRIA
ncbi:MAG TPA: YeeE/YedE family protein [Candidatus Dormibacteraeota bacterium]|nr:YeeE/YedE family protein [Candidatus Dormibacteraeota bacterium]